jgi:hypothetical protein
MIKQSTTNNLQLLISNQLRVRDFGCKLLVGCRGLGVRRQGYVVMSVLVFAAVFALITSSLVGYVFVQSKAVHIKSDQEQAFSLAEAGLNYYKWHLAHWPDDFQDGTGAEGPYVHAVNDLESDTVGTFSLDVLPNMECGEASGIDISSTGRPEDSNIERTVVGRYARPSVAEYAFIIDSNVWAGPDREIHGKYHSNGGIRMDGSNDSPVTSSQEDWFCTDAFGCSSGWFGSGGETKPGVFGAGAGDELWSYPVPQMDFGGITSDLVTMEDRADLMGIKLGAVGGQSGQHGWHLIFKGNGTVDIYKVKKTTKVWSDVTGAGDWEEEGEVIKEEDFIENRALPGDCKLIFVEDELWIEGEIEGKVTVVAAKPKQPNFESDAILSGNLTYHAGGASDGLTLIAENSIRIPINSPYNMTLNGIFIAQNGNFGRNYYTTSGSRDVPGSYDDEVKRGALVINGTIVSKGRVGTQWVSGSDTFLSGYSSRVNTYDRSLATDPPPLTPFISEEYRFVDWSDEK